MSARQKLAKAQEFIGYLYFRGEGIGRDYKQAVQYYKMAIEQGSADARVRLAEMYRDGIGVVKDNQQALKHL